MSTHSWRCVVCDERVSCTADEHCLGSGGSYCDGFKQPPVEFCSTECFMELRATMEKSRLNAIDLHPEWEPELRVKG